MCNKLFGLFFDSLFCFHFGVCSPLSLFLKGLKDCEISGFIELNCDKLHID